jgi:hypothetical protein
LDEFLDDFPRTSFFSEISTKFASLKCLTGPPSAKGLAGSS